MTDTLVGESMWKQVGVTIQRTVLAVVVTGVASLIASRATQWQRTLQKGAEEGVSTEWRRLGRVTEERAAWMKVLLPETPRMPVNRAQMAVVAGAGLVGAAGAWAAWHYWGHAGEENGQAGAEAPAAQKA